VWALDWVWPLVCGTAEGAAAAPLVGAWLEPAPALVAPTAAGAGAPGLPVTAAGAELGPTSAAAFFGFGAGIGAGESDCWRSQAIRLIRSCGLLMPAKVILVPET